MKDAPPLRDVNNRFTVLTIQEIDDSEPEVAPKPAEFLTTPKTKSRRKHWERRLPNRLVIAVTEPGPRALHVKLELETVDTAETRQVRALVDSGATGMFIDSKYVRTNGLTTRKLG